MMMASSFQLQTLPSASTFLHKSHFIGQIHFTRSTQKHYKPPLRDAPTAKFNIYEMLGGRGLCRGEEGLQQELMRTVSEEESSSLPNPSQPETEENAVTLQLSEDAFEKELLGLTGGFPGGEKGLQKFIEKNPPPKKAETEAKSSPGSDQSLVEKPKNTDIAGDRSPL